MMLAKGEGIPQVLIFLVIVVVVIIRAIVEYSRRQKAREEIKRERLQQGAGDRREPGGEKRRRPAGGLEALLEALAEGDAPSRQREPERPSPPEGPEPRTWDVDAETVAGGGSLVEPSTLELEGGRRTEAEFGRRGGREAVEREPAVRTFEDYRAEREAEIRRQKERARELREEAARDREPRRLRPSVPELEAGPVPEAAAGIAPEGKPPSVADARKGILWSVVLGPPRALARYGERGAVEPPGGRFD